MSSRSPPLAFEVYNEAQSKYKCASCLAPYCSLACFKKHKENPCKKPLPLVKELPNLIILQRTYEVDEPSWVVDKEQLRMIANSSEICEASKDGRLRRIIQKIDGSDDPENEGVSLSLSPICNISRQLTEAMEGRILHDVAGKILSVVSSQD